MSAYVPPPSPLVKWLDSMKADPTNATRQARHRKARALGYVAIPAGYLPPKRAAKVRQWLAEAERLMEPDEARVLDALE